MTNELQEVLDDIQVDKFQNLKPENIKSGVKVLGVEGILNEGVNTTDATATTNDLLYPKTAYVNGTKITGRINTVYEPSKNIEAESTLTIAGSYNANNIYDYDYKHSLYVALASSYADIGYIDKENSKVLAYSKRITIADLTTTKYNVQLVDAKFSRVNLEGSSYIKLFISLRSNNTNTTSYPQYNEIYLVKLDKETLDILDVKCQTYGNYLDSTYNCERNSMIIHPNKDLMVAVFPGSANGGKLRYMAVYYNETTDTLSTILTGSASITNVYYNNVTFYRGYCTKDGYANICLGGSGYIYSYVFKFTDNNTCSLFWSSSSTPRRYLNNGNYLLGNLLYNSAGTLLSYTEVPNLGNSSYVDMIGDVLFYSNNTTSATGSIFACDLSGLTPKALDLTLSSMNPFLRVSNNNLFVGNSSNSSLTIYKPSEETLTCLTRDNVNYCSSNLTTATSADILYEKTAISQGSKIIGTMKNYGELEVNPNTIEQIYNTPGYFSKLTVHGDTDLKSENIVFTTNIFGYWGKAPAVFSTVEEMEQWGITAPENTFAIVYGTTYVGTYRRDNGQWTQVGDASEGQQIMDTLNKVANTLAEYEGNGGTDEEINTVLNNIMGGNL